MFKVYSTAFGEDSVLEFQTLAEAESEMNRWAESLENLDSSYREKIVIEEDGETVDSITRLVHPACPVEDPIWETPLAIVGGIKQNPGVFGSGGGVKYTEVDILSGVVKKTDTWGTDPQNGTRMETVSYSEAVDFEDLWAAHQAGQLENTKAFLEAWEEEIEELQEAELAC